MAGSNEFFYIDKNGVKQDRALHEELLGKDLNGIVHESSINVARSIGLTDDEMRAIGLLPLKKVVPYKEAEPYREEDDSITPTATSHGSSRMTTYEGSAANDAKPSGPSVRSVHEGRAEASATGGKSDPTSDATVPGSGLKTRGRRRVV